MENGQVKLIRRDHTALNIQEPTQRYNVIEKILQVKGGESQAVAYANTGFASYEAESDHRIWWTQDDVDSIATHSDDSF